jgi:SAM-dependent methyltransferase
MPLTESLAYVDRVVGEFERYGGLDGKALAGARVLELGPGDNLGVALRLLGMGASRVVCLDRFVTWRDPEQQCRINEALASGMPAAERERLVGILDDGASIRGDQDRLVLIEGTPIEEADSVLETGSFDCVISRAVLAHVYDLDAAYDVMDRLLVQGGRMAHKVDLSDIHLFTNGGQHPLTFLTISDPIWDRMRRYAGHSNRSLVDYHRRKLAELGYAFDIRVTRLIGGDEFAPIGMEEVAARVGPALPLVEELRPQLLPRYRGLSDEELAIADVFIEARKPDGTVA